MVHNIEIYLMCLCGSMSSSIDQVARWSPAVHEVGGPIELV